MSTRSTKKVVTTEETGSHFVPSESVATTEPVATTEEVVTESVTTEPVVPESVTTTEPVVTEPEATHSFMRTTFVMTPDQEMSQEAWDSIQEQLDVLNVESLKITIEYCRDRLQELQRAEIEALEAEMRAIQQKLFSMKGVTTSAHSVQSPTTTRVVKKPIVNPANLHECYSMGRTPDWLKELMAKTGKTIDQLRNGN